MSTPLTSPRQAVETPDRTTLIAFVLLVVVGGGNAVAVRLSNLDLPPFWGAAARFGLTGLVFWAILFFRRIEVPRGRALVGTLLYGLFSIGFAYALLYWALLTVTASLTMVTLALVPLLTLLFAVAHRIEPFHWRGLLGAVISLAGIMLSLSGQLGSQAPLGPVLALIGGAACIAEASVIYKLFPKSHPVATNALAVSSGAIFLLVISLITGENQTLPANLVTWTALLYLILVGSVLLFYLYLLVLGRWTASVTSYSFLLFPISTILIAAVVTGEVITPIFLFGSLVVMVGVWIGAIARPAGIKSSAVETN